MLPSYSLPSEESAVTKSGASQTQLPQLSQQITHLDRVVLARGSKNVLDVWVPVQAMDFGEVGCEVLHSGAGFLQQDQHWVLSVHKSLVECLPSNSTTRSCLPLRNSTLFCLKQTNKHATTTKKTYPALQHAWHIRLWAGLLSIPAPCVALMKDTRRCVLFPRGGQTAELPLTPHLLAITQGEGLWHVSRPAPTILGVNPPNLK